MRALLSTIGSRGDVQPLVALASQLRALGHEARLCVPPDFKAWVEAFGIPVTPIGPEVRKFAISRPSVPAGPPSLEQMRQLMEATVANQFVAITEAAQWCDVIVGATALQIAARSVAEKKGVPYVFAAYCPIVVPSAHHAPPPLTSLGQLPAPTAAANRELWAQDAERFNSTFAAALNAQRASLGMAPVDDVRGHMFTDQPWLAADPILAPWPDPAGVAVVQTGAWFLPDERPLSAKLRTFLDAGDPPVFFGFGSMRTPEGVREVVARGARALGRRAIVSRGWADLSLADNEPDCLTIGEENLQALFTRVAAVVHHGGAGTTTIAALAGTPQVVVPQVYDQHYWARRVHDLGIGTAHAPGAPTTNSLTAALESALTPEVAARARTVAAGVSRDGAQAAAQRLIRQCGAA
jgi:vancomycin aglycone glucosyltransferase